MAVPQVSVSRIVFPGWSRWCCNEAGYGAPQRNGPMIANLGEKEKEDFVYI